MKIGGAKSRVSREAQNAIERERDGESWYGKYSYLRAIIPVPIIFASNPLSSWSITYEESIKQGLHSGARSCPYSIHKNKNHMCVYIQSEGREDSTQTIEKTLGVV